MTHCTRWRHAARGGNPVQRSGPGALQGRSGGTGWTGELGIVDWVYPGYGTEVNSEEHCQGPTHVPNSAKQCQNVPSFLIEPVFDEVSQTGY